MLNLVGRTTSTVPILSYETQEAFNSSLLPYFFVGVPGTLNYSWSSHTQNITASRILGFCFNLSLALLRTALFFLEEANTGVLLEDGV